MTKFTTLLALLFVIYSLSIEAATTTISATDANSYIQMAQPGDTLILRNGTYHELRLRLLAHGTASHPIVVQAEEGGKVVLSGASNLRIGGEYLEVSGLFFKQGYSPEGPVIEYRVGNTFANHCRVSHCAIAYFNPPSRSTGYFWVLMHGQNNRFDHNSLEGKLNIEMTLVVDLGDERSQRNGHRIEYNYFGYRPIFGSNGGETIRVGNSYTQFYPSQTVISNNIFEQCNGEVEVVSIKSSDNIVRRNLFLECAGVLALRHGNGTLVEENAFVGNGKPFSGGVRVVNEGHIIRNNLFYHLTGDRFFSTLALMNAVPNSLPNRYHHVKNILIEGNRFIECPNILFGVGKDNERTQAPSDIMVTRNDFYSTARTKPFALVDETAHITFTDNRINYPQLSKQKGFINDKNINAQLELTHYPSHSETGAEWYSIIGNSLLPTSGRTSSVAPGQNTLLQAVAHAQHGDTLELEGGALYTIDKAINIDKAITLRLHKGATQRAELRYNGSKKAPFILLHNGSQLTVEGLYFNGITQLGKASANYGITTAPRMITPYTLTIRHCEFSHFESGGTGGICGGKGTFSEQVIVDGCYFHDMVGDGIQFANEKDDRGVYSVEHISVTHCLFVRMLGSALEVYRGGNDESTSGPSVVVDHCTFDDVNNREQGSVVKLWGTQQAKVTNSIFVNSGRGGASIRFNEMRWDKIEVSHINLYNSGRIYSFWGKVIKGNITQKNPRFSNPLTADYSLSNRSPLRKKGSNKTDLGFINHTLLPTQSNK